MRVLIPMGGKGRRFREAGYLGPKPLLPVRGQPLVAHLLERFPKQWPRVFFCDEEQLATTELRRVLGELAPEGTIVPVPPHDQGPVRTVLLGLRRAPALLADDEACLVNYCDFDFSWDPIHFRSFAKRTRCDGAVLCYTGFHPEYLRPTLYAYCREEGGRLLDIREKGHFTPDRTREYASSGTYYFRSGALVRRYFRRLMDEGPLLNGEGYVSLVFRPMLADGLHCRVYEIPRFLQWGTPEDLADHAYWAEVFGRYPWAGVDPATLPADQLLMPMAGKGSRFPPKTPKPLVPVLGQPMFQAALAHLPVRGRRVLVVREELAAEVRGREPEADTVVLRELTEGQAVTCALAAPALAAKESVLVSSCDHGLVWDTARWRALLAEGPDLVVVGQRGYPGAARTPRAFAYITCGEGTDRVTGVSVKRPLSATPRRDLVLVGTFWFRQAGQMLSLIEELRHRDLRVDGELYLDSVIDLALERGWEVRAFEADGYLCWGTPDAVAEFEYWYGYFAGTGGRAER